MSGSAVAPIVVVMGISGSGKTTLGRALADALGCPFADGDDLHSAASITKMASGVPLDEGDRRPWLDRIGAWIDARVTAGSGGVVACSALKRAHRERLSAGRSPVRFVYLRCTRELAAERLAARRGHFFPQRLIDSQLADLEPPRPEERALVVACDQDVAAAAAEIARRLSPGAYGA